MQYFQCGAAGAACEIGGRHYNIVAPEGPGPFPVVIVFHGSRHSGDAYIQRDALVHPFLRRGYAFVAPTALDINYASGPGTGWLNSGERNGRNDHKFIDDMLDDLAARFPIDDQRILVAGQSNGAIFSWYLACAELDPRLRHFAPHAGTPGIGRFDLCQNSDLERNPKNLNQIFGFQDRCNCSTYLAAEKTCVAGFTDGALGFRLLHTHGLNDPVVPARGGTRENGTWNYHSSEKLVLSLAEKAGCQSIRQATQGSFEKTVNQGCRSGGEYGFAFHPGGHSAPHDWPDLILDWFESF